jgi:hypothetical protein
MIMKQQRKYNPMDVSGNDRMWMLYFEASKWGKTLKLDTAMMIDEINELLYPGTKGR